MEAHNFLKRQCGGETPCSELGASILEKFSNANTLAKKLLYTIYDRVVIINNNNFKMEPCKP